VHEELYEALSRRDAQQVAAAMARHFDAIETSLRRELREQAEALG